MTAFGIFLSREDIGWDFPSSDVTLRHLRLETKNNGCRSDIVAGTNPYLTPLSIHVFLAFLVYQIAIVLPIVALHILLFLQASHLLQRHQARSLFQS